MKIQSFSIVSGTSQCNASCPFCISKMTGFSGIYHKPEKINWVNFDKACRLAQLNNVSSVIITGKGEPTLFPNQITDYLKRMRRYNFPLIELQTNGIAIAQNPRKFNRLLNKWYKLGLGLIAISIVHYDSEKNRQNYLPLAKDYINLEKLVKILREKGFSVRLTCTLTKGNIDNPKDILYLIEKAESWRAEQLTLRPVARPLHSESQSYFNKTGALMLTDKNINDIKEVLDRSGHRLITYGHGSVLYDVNGQNVCLTNALTIKSNTEDIRQLIFFPNGRLRFDWQFKGAIIL